MLVLLQELINQARKNVNSETPRGNRRLNYTSYRIALTQISTTKGTDQARIYYQKKLVQGKPKN